VTSTPQRLRELSPLWLGLLLTIRIATGAAAVALLSVHYVTSYDGTLTTAVIVYVAITTLAARRWPHLTAHPTAWAGDILAVLVLVYFSEDWRSPFYLLALTTLAAPAAVLRPAGATALGVGFAAVYAVMGHVIGPSPLTIGTQATVETLATHLLLPILLCFGVSYAAEAVRRLRTERRRAERLAIEAERQRIAWELHDSAKQRVHAAHLVLSSAAVAPDDERAAAAVAQVLHELEAAAADMDTSLAELRSPLEGRPLGTALRERARELTLGAGPEIAVAGEAPPLDPLTEAHAYRVASEAMTNAVRHAQSQRVEVRLEASNGLARIVVDDDGRGLPDEVRPGSNGMRVMRNRAATIGGELTVAPRDGGGTRVELRFPLSRPEGGPA
jgi:signal transduction histidine kinase